MLRILLVGAGAAVSIKDVEDGYLHALREQPGVEVVYYDLSSRLSMARRWLNNLWRKRGSVPEQRPGWPDAIYRGSVEALEMALRYQVDWVVVVSGMYFHPDVLEMLRRARFRTGVLLTESPYQDAEQARLASLADVVWTNERTSVDKLYPANREVRYMRHAYDPARHQPAAASPDVPEHDVVFVGTGFVERVRLLEAVDWSGIDLGLYGEWSLLGSRHRLRKYVRGGYTTNAHTVALYRSAKIGLNLHRTSQSFGREVPHVLDAESMNPRAYELAACEVFHVSDRRPELAETLGDAVPTFGTPRELEMLVRIYVNHSPERRRLARLARERIASHTFAARAAQLLTDLDTYDDRSLAKGA